MSALTKRPAFEAMRREDERGEFWSARDLQGPLGYTEWRKFEDSIERAQAAALNSGTNVADHFGGADKMVEIGSRAIRLVVDYRLSRYGSYLVAMNGDPRKPEIAAAQSYFAARTREAEVRETAQHAIPQTYAAALIEAGKQAEAREAAERQVAALTPRAAVADALINTTGDYSLREAAQILARDHGIDTGQNRLSRHLRSIGWTDAVGKPYQRHITCGRLVRRATTYEHPTTGDRVPTSQLRITGKGLAELHTLLSRAEAPPARALTAVGA